MLIGYATGKQIHTSTRTTGATAAPIARPYREQTDWGMIYVHNQQWQSIIPNIIEDIIFESLPPQREVSMLLKSG